MLIPHILIGVGSFYILWRKLYVYKAIHACNCVMTDTERQWRRQDFILCGQLNNLCVTIIGVHDRWHAPTEKLNFWSLKKMFPAVWRKNGLNFNKWEKTRFFHLKKKFEQVPIFKLLGEKRS